MAWNYVVKSEISQTKSSEFNGSKLANYVSNLHTFLTVNRFPESNLKHVSMGYKRCMLNKISTDEKQIISEIGTGIAKK